MNKILKVLIICNIFWTVGFISFLGFLFFSFPIGKSSSSDVSSLIGFDNISETDISWINEIYSDVNPIYLSNINEIWITYNRTKLKTKDSDPVGTYLLGEVKIWFTHNEKEMKRVLCHELLHSKFFERGEKEEEMVSRLDDYLPCFGK